METINKINKIKELLSELGYISLEITREGEEYIYNFYNPKTEKSINMRFMDY